MVHPLGGSMSGNGTTPSLSQTIYNIVRSELVNLHVGMPGIVQKYDASKQMADIQPALKRKYSDGSLVNLPIITNVPIGHLRANNAIIHVPVKVGDTVFLHFSERSLDNWLSNGGV